MVEQQDRCLTRFADVIKHDLTVDVAAVPGAGTAGGMRAAFHAVLGARLRPGCEVMTDALGLDYIIADPDLVVTGEGRTDGHTIFGKAPVGVARVAARHQVPVIILSGSLTLDSAVVLEAGIDAVFSAVRHPCALEEVLSGAAVNLRAAARSIAAGVRLGLRMKSRAATSAV